MKSRARLMLMPERETYYLGQTVRVRARIFDRNLKALDAEEVPFRIFTTPVNTFELA